MILLTNRSKSFQVCESKNMTEVFFNHIILLIFQHVQMKSKISNLPSLHFIILMPSTNSRRNVDNDLVVYAKPEHYREPFDRAYQNLFTITITIARLKMRQPQMLWCHRFRLPMIWEVTKTVPFRTLQR